MIISNKNISCYEVESLKNSGNLTFDNAIQRGYVWDKERKSLLVHSILGGFPIPPIYAQQLKGEEDSVIYDTLDGKQRLLTISKFITDEFELGELDEIVYFNNESKSEELLNISHKKFSELPKEIQRKFENFQINMVIVNGTDDDISEMFYRLNNGKPLSTIEHSRVKAKDLQSIKEIGDHDIFKDALTEKAMAKYTNEEIVVKSYIVLKETDNPDLTSKNIKEKLSTITIDKDTKEELQWSYDYILDAHKKILQDTTDEKLNKKVAKRILTRTHLITLVALCSECRKQNTPIDVFVEFLQYFYSGKRRATINETYNDNASVGSAKPSNVKRRIEILISEFNKYIIES